MSDILTQREGERIEKVVSKLRYIYDSADSEGMCPMLDVCDVVNLLHRELAKERARVRKVITEYRKRYGQDVYGQGSGIDIGIRSACKGILTALRVRRRERQYSSS